jgi:hypothetical protein
LASVRIAAVREKSGEDVMRVLPDRLRDVQRCFGRNGAKDLHAVLLAVDEAVFLTGS